MAAAGWGHKVRLPSRNNPAIQWCGERQIKLVRWQLLLFSAALWGRRDFFIYIYIYILFVSSRFAPEFATGVSGMSSCCVCGAVARLSHSGTHDPIIAKTEYGVVCELIRSDEKIIISYCRRNLLMCRGPYTSKYHWYRRRGQTKDTGQKQKN
jgi:hypothetical protein